MLYFKKTRIFLLTLTFNALLLSTCTANPNCFIELSTSPTLSQSPEIISPVASPVASPLSKRSLQIKPVLTANYSPQSIFKSIIYIKLSFFGIIDNKDYYKNILERYTNIVILGDLIDNEITAARLFSKSYFTRRFRDIKQNFFKFAQSIAQDPLYTGGIIYLTIQEPFYPIELNLDY